MSPEQIVHVKHYIKNLKPSLCGKFFYYCIPFRKKVMLQNMHLVFGQHLSAKEIRKLAQGFYSHLARSISENIALHFMSEENIRQRAIVVGEENIIDPIDKQEKGMILITGHFGNWEFAPIAGMLNFKRFRGRLYFVRKTLSNKTIEKILFKRYYQAGLRVISKKNSLEKVCDALESKNAVVFVHDQHASIKAKDGMMIDFFGKPAGTYKSPAMLANYMKVPVIPARSYRRKDGMHVLEFFPPIPWQSASDKNNEIAVNLRAYNQALENMILEYPDQWLWVHRRWKST
jgi:KDO2-lipid IV(A) lauroyltransferase